MPRSLNRYGIQVRPLCVFFGTKLTTTTLLRTLALACVLSILGGVSWVRSARAATIELAAGGDLQAAIYNAAPGDTIILQAGATYTGNFYLPNKSGDAFITIRTSTSDAELPEGVRVTPADAGKLAKIVTPGNGMPAIHTGTAAHHYRLIGLEIMPATPQSIVYEVVSLGSAGGEQDTLDKVPHHFTIDRCFIHGHPNANFKRGVGLNSAHTEILNSHISDFHSDYQDSQAIGGFNGPGPFKIINNRIEGAAENIMFGGATPAIYGLVPSNVEIRRNHLYKPMSWKPGEPGSTAYRPWVKNLFEIKNGQDFIIDGNIMENNWYQTDQHGTAIVLSPRSEGGAAPWVVVQRITFTNNRITNVGGGVGILGKDDGAPNDIATNNVTFRNNLFEKIRNDYSIDGSRVIQIAGSSRITFDHNTILHANDLLRGRGAQTEALNYTNNITHYSGYGLSAECGFDQAALNCHFPGHTFLNNAIIRSPYGAFGASNFYPADEAAVGFTNYAGGDYRLAGSSPYRFAGTDGKDLGADIDAIEAAYRGGTATPQPTPTPSPTPTPTPVPTPTPTPTPTPVPTPTPTPIPTPTPTPIPTPTPTPTPQPVPTAPSNLAAQTVSSTRINLTWVDNATNETGFKVERSNDGATFAQIGIVGANVRSYSDLGVRANKTYFYRVRAYNAAGHSGYSNTISAKTPRR